MCWFVSVESRSWAQRGFAKINWLVGIPHSLYFHFHCCFLHFHFLCLPLHPRSFVLHVPLSLLSCNCVYIQLLVLYPNRCFLLFVCFSIHRAHYSPRFASHFFICLTISRLSFFRLHCPSLSLLAVSLSLPFPVCLFIVRAHDLSFYLVSPPLSFSLSVCVFFPSGRGHVPCFSKRTITIITIHFLVTLFL